jgi:hypothetical protein
MVSHGVPITLSDLRRSTPFKDFLYVVERFLIVITKVVHIPSESSDLITS